jgi:hypothetical protein
MDIPSADNIVLQTFDDNRYCSGLLAGRYQIFESKFYENQYCVFDHKTQEVIRAKNNEYFMLFPSINSAEGYLGVDANSAPALTNKKGVRIMNRYKKDRKVTNSAPKVAAKASTRKRGESALSYLKDLIKTNSALSDHDIAAMVQAKFPESKYNHSMVKFNRKKMGG